MTYTPSPLILNRYANLLVTYALNSGKGLKPGESVYITIPESAKPLYAPLRNAVLKAGGHPVMMYRAEGVGAADFYALASDEQLTFAHNHFFKGIVTQFDHTISILAEADKYELQAVDPQKIMMKARSQQKFFEWRQAKEARGKFTWTLAMYGTPAMAKDVGLTEEQYWKQIIKACYLDDADPVARWKEIARELESTKNKLNKLQIDCLHVEGDDVDLWVGLGPNRQWLGGGGRNIPSFELFVSPDWRRTDGTAVLGLGNIGPAAAQPVMAGKAMLFAELAGLNSIPLVLACSDTDELIRTIRAVAPSFGGINLEDIAAPECFAVEAALQDLGIPVMHDDQHGTAIVVAAGMGNALKVTGRVDSQNNLTSAIRIVVNGAGAGGTAVALMLVESLGPKAEVIVIDSKGIIALSRSDLNGEKQKLAAATNPHSVSGSLADALIGATAFVGLSVAGALPAELIATMAKDPIIFALANPTPEIMPNLALAAGAAVVATGRSDFPNQVNNVLAFPALFKGAMDAQATKFIPEMFHAAVTALRDFIPNPTPTSILPIPLDRAVTNAVSKAVERAARDAKIGRDQIN